MSKPRQSPLPAELALLVVLEAFFSLFALLAVAFPPSPEAPVHLDLFAGIAAAGITLVNLRLGAALPRWLLHLELLGTLGTCAAIVACAHTRPGVAEPVLGSLVLFLYVACTLPPRVVGAYLLAVVVALSCAGLSTSAVLDPRVGVPLVLSFLLLDLVVGQLLDRLRRQAETDQLTGLLNRRGLEATAERELARAATDGRPRTLVLFDLDGLKGINDTLGHLAGDRLIQSFAHHLYCVARPPGLVAARHAGDEFVLVVPGDPERVELLLAQLHALGAPPSCWGSALWERGEGYDSWFGRADAALYRAKAARSAESR